MTIERRRLLAAAGLALAGWLAVLALVMRLGGAPAALVVLPPPGFLARLPPGVAVAERGPWSVTLRGGADLAAWAYAAGAPLVLPAGLDGCGGRPERPRG